MSFVVLPDSMVKELDAADDPLPLVSIGGRVIGYFTPAKPGKRLDIDLGISDEELDRREAAGGGRPLADILRDLEKRA